MDGVAGSLNLSFFEILPKYSRTRFVNEFDLTCRGHHGNQAGMLSTIRRTTLSLSRRSPQPACAPRYRRCGIPTCHASLFIS